MKPPLTDRQREIVEPVGELCVEIAPAIPLEDSGHGSRTRTATA